MAYSLTDLIIGTCDAIYEQLGPSHNECVYQKALILELYNIGARSVEFEKHVPVFFKDSVGTVHTIGDERIDILATFEDDIVLMELKAVAKNRLPTCVDQLNKYKRALAYLNIYPTKSILVNFPQQMDTTKVESMVILFESKNPLHERSGPRDDRALNIE